MHVKIVFWSVCSLHLEYLVFWYKFWTLNSLYFRTEGVVKIFHWILWSMQWTCLYLLYMCSWRHYFFWYFPSASLQTHFIDYVRGQAGWQVRMRFSDKICSRHKLAKLIPHSFCSSNQLCYFDAVFSNSHHKQGCNICFSFHFHMNLFS